MSVKTIGAILIHQAILPIQQLLVRDWLGIAQWANLLELQATPVVEDQEAAESMSKVYGK